MTPSTSTATAALGAPMSQVRKPRKAAAPAVDAVAYRAVRAVTVGGNSYAPGDVIPEAVTWPRVDAWVRARHIEKVA